MRRPVPVKAPSNRMRRPSRPRQGTAGSFIRAGERYSGAVVLRRPRPTGEREPRIRCGRPRAWCWFPEDRQRHALCSLTARFRGTTRR